MDDQDYLEANDALYLARQRPFLFNHSSVPSDFKEPFQEPNSVDVSAVADPVYEQFLADVWVGIVLTLMVLSCVCFMCTCLVYHKIQEWKIRALQNRHSQATLENGYPESELPSYTVASGLPTYDEALEQLKKYPQNHHDFLATHQIASKSAIKEDDTVAIEDRLEGCGSKTDGKTAVTVSEGRCETTPALTHQGSSSSIFKFFKGSKRLSKSTT